MFEKRRIGHTRNKTQLRWQLAQYSKNGKGPDSEISEPLSVIYWRELAFNDLYA